MDKIINSLNCTSCGICQVVCPKNAIKMNYSSGFPVPIVDTELCVNCGICFNYCCKDFEVTEVSKPNYYAGWTTDDISRKKSTSGGFAYEAAKFLVEKGYNYLGVEMNLDELCAQAYATKSVEDIDKSRGSKYITAHFETALKEISNGEKWIIVTTPCSAVALDNYFKTKKQRENVILIDMLCAGPANELLLKKYVKEKCIEYGKTQNDIDKILFRDKSEIGWSATMKIYFKDGTSTKIKSSNDDEFFSIFYSRASQKDACYKCKLDRNKSCADLRISDFWGEKFKGNKEGVSAVIAYTPSGNALVQDLVEADILQVLEVKDSDIFNKQLDKPQRMPFQRKFVLRAITDDTKLVDIQNRYIKPIKFERRVREKLKRMSTNSSFKAIRSIGKRLKT